MSQSGDPNFTATRRLHYQGDTCEKISLVRHGLGSIPFPDADSVSCSSPNGCEVSWNAQIDYMLTSEPYVTTGDYGFRFCKCDVSGLSSSFGRRICDNNNTCPFQGKYFASAQGTGWLPITLPDQNGKLQKGGKFSDLFGELNSLDKIRVSSKKWDIRLDKETLETFDPSDVTTYQTKGLLWAHAESEAASHDFQQGDTGPDNNHPVAYTDRSNVYSDGSVSVRVFPRVSIPLPLPPFGQKLVAGPAWNYCPSCPMAFKEPFLDLRDGTLDDRVFAVTGQSQVEITQFLPLEVRQILRATTGTRVFASEPVSVLEQFGTRHWTGVALSDSFALDHVIDGGANGLRLRGGRATGGGTTSPTVGGGAPSAVGVNALATSTTATLPPAEGAFLVAMATRNTVVRVGGLVDGKANSQIHWLDVSSGLWSSNDLVGEHPGRVLAATYRFSDKALYVVDEGKSGKKQVARLLRVLRNGVVELLATWPRILKADITLSVSTNDELVFSFSKELEHAVLIAGVSPTGSLSPRGFAIKPGKLLAAPHLTEAWMTEYLQQGLTRKVRDVPRKEFLTVGCSLLLGWW